MFLIVLMSFLVNGCYAGDLREYATKAGVEVTAYHEAGYIGDVSAFYSYGYVMMMFHTAERLGSVADRDYVKPIVYDMRRRNIYTYTLRNLNDTGRILLEFKEFDLHPSSLLYIYDGSDSSASGTIWTRKSNTPMFVSSGPDLFVVFKTGVADGMNPYMGFRVHVHFKGNINRRDIPITGVCAPFKENRVSLWTIIRSPEISGKIPGNNLGNAGDPGKITGIPEKSPGKNFRNTRGKIPGQNPENNPGNTPGFPGSNPGHFHQNSPGNYEVFCPYTSHRTDQNVLCMLHPTSLQTKIQVYDYPTPIISYEIHPFKVTRFNFKSDSFFFLCYDLSTAKFGFHFTIESRFASPADAVIISAARSLSEAKLQAMFLLTTRPDKEFHGCPYKACLTTEPSVKATKTKTNLAKETTVRCVDYWESCSDHDDATCDGLPDSAAHLCDDTNRHCFHANLDKCDGFNDCPGGKGEHSQYTTTDEPLSCPHNLEGFFIQDKFTLMQAVGVEGALLMITTGGLMFMMLLFTFKCRFTSPMKSRYKYFPLGRPHRLI